MKIAIISSGFLPAIDGVTVTQFQRIQKLSQLGHQVLLFCPDYSPLEKLYPDWRNYTGNILPGVSVVNLPSSSFADIEFERNVKRSSYGLVLRELDRFQPDIIHVDEPERLWLGFLRVAGVNFAHRQRLPCVSFFHTNFLDYLEDYLPLPSGMVRAIKFGLKFHLSWVYNSYDATLVASKVTSEKLGLLGINNRVTANLLGVDAAKFSPRLRDENFFQQKYGLPNCDRLVKLIFLGRLTPDKGWKLAIDALGEFLSAGNAEKIAIAIAGDGPMRGEIAEKLGKLTPNLHLLGRIPHEDVPALLVNGDIYLTASEKETKGLTILEALAAGIPAIAPRAGGIIDTIRSGENGLLYNPQDREDLIEKLQYLIADPARRKVMGAKGKEDMAEYSWDKAVQNLLHIWSAQIVKGKLL